MISRILVPLDLHRLSEAKVPVAAAQAQAFGADLILLHVCPPTRAPGKKTTFAEARARTYLDALVARLRADGIEAQPVIRWGRPTEAILQEIEAQQVDLVILGRSSRQGLSEWLLGSVAKAVIARATCPVLLMQPPSTQTSPPPAVRSFTEDALRAGTVAPRELGLRTVDMSRIIGSVGRAQDLRADFRNRRPSSAERQRFERIQRLLESGAGLPPIVLYKLGYGYYVLDGHHRVAAARQQGQLDIDALVTEFVPVGDPQAQQVAAERRTFERATGLQRIGACRPDTYPRLEALIRAYAAEHDIPDLHEAAQRWETQVYLPVAALVREDQLSQQFPGERTADVFLRLAAYRDEVARTTSESLEWSDVLERLQTTTPAAE